MSQTRDPYSINGETPGCSDSGQNMNGELTSVYITDQSAPPHDHQHPCLRVQTNRPLMNQLELYSKFGEDDCAHGVEKTCCYPFGRSLRRQMLNYVGDFSLISWLLRRIPILSWLPRYSWKESVASDLTAGFTVAVMHVPQGMAYALLAEVPPVVGIYMAFFPIFVYIILGTSRHVSMGTFAVICLMTGKVVNRVMHEHETEQGTCPYSPIQIGTLVSFVVGLIQVFMGILRLGAVSLLLSPSLVGGFTTGAAVHVFTSQVRNFFGLTLPRRSGFFKVPLTYFDIASHIPDTNLATVIVSAVTLLTLGIYNELIKPFISKRLKIPMPIEFIAVVMGTLVSYYMDLHGKYGVSIIANIPTGLPSPTTPVFELLWEVALDSAMIAFVSYAISISMAKIFALKHKYNIDPDQELFAQGSCNVFGSFFSCVPVAVSLSRSLVQDSVGGKTQLTSFFSCLFLLSVLLWIGPLFEALPNCVLAGIIVVALKGMFMQSTELPQFWRTSRLHGLIWLSSFLGTILLDIPYGLAVGLLMTTIALLWRSTRAEVSTMGRFANSELFVEMDETTNERVREISGVKILKFTGTLNFATIDKFLESVVTRINVHSANIEVSGSSTPPSTNNLRKMASTSSTIAIATAEENDVSNSRDDLSKIRCVILDLSSASSIEATSLPVISQLQSSFRKDDITFYLTGCPLTVIKEMRNGGFFRKFRRDHLFHTIHDALIACQRGEALGHVNGHDIDDAHVTDT